MHSLEEVDGSQVPLLREIKHIVDRVVVSEVRVHDVLQCDLAIRYSTFVRVIAVVYFDRCHYSHDDG